jgi:hypothetical protein
MSKQALMMQVGVRCGVLVPCPLPGHRVCAVLTSVCLKLAWKENKLFIFDSAHSYLDFVPL